MVNDTRYGSAHAASRRKSWVRQNLLLLPPKRLFAMRFSLSVSFILAIQALGELNGIELRTAFLRLRLRNEFTAKAAFFAFDLP
jgi:hypothetical protein